MLSFEEKLARANHHLEELLPELRRWIQDRPYTIIDKFDPNTGYNVIYGQIRRSPPAIIPQLIGDCLYNLRSSLDHLVYALAVANKGSLTDAEATDTAFPIFQYSAGFNKRGKGRIRYASPRAQTLIERLQPYHATEPTNHPLWLLDKLNNIDKHRRLLITLLSPIGAGTRVPDGARLIGFQWSDEFALKHTQIEIARYRCVSLKDSGRVKMEFRPTFVAVFNDAPADERIVWTTLESLVRYVGQVVVPRLRPLL